MMLYGILVSEIGEGNNALLCITDLLQCCRGNQIGTLGEWLYPNGSLVQDKYSGDNFYRNRGNSTVQLNHRNNDTSPTGQFCCVVPDATFMNTSVCANIRKVLKFYMLTNSCNTIDYVVTVLELPTIIISTNAPIQGECYHFLL